MILAYRYGRKKYDERKQRGRQPATEDGQAATEDGQAATEDEQTAEADAGGPPPAQDGIVHDAPEGAETLAEKKARRRYRWKILFGLVAPFTLQGLDTTIIASALPFIATDFSAPPLPNPIVGQS